MTLFERALDMMLMEEEVRTMNVGSGESDKSRLQAFSRSRTARKRRELHTVSSAGLGPHRPRIISRRQQRAIQVESKQREMEYSLISLIGGREA